jgi:hypothetical protein
MPLLHHELCFGCGRTNLFGLLLEVEEVAPGAVAGRCFIKQDHQGADGGRAHDGIVAAALAEAMALACGLDARAVSFEVSLNAPALVDGDLTPGSPISIRMDQALLQDATGTMALMQFEELGEPRIKVERAVQYVDHNVVQLDFKNPDDHRMLQALARKYGLHFSRPGNGTPLRDRLSGGGRGAPRGQARSPLGSGQGHHPRALATVDCERRQKQGARVHVAGDA